jgi:hypothetical protein
MLARCVGEGAQDFITELVAARSINSYSKEWATCDVAEMPKICRSYYAQATDKAKAIRDVMRLESVEKSLAPGFSEVALLTRLVSTGIIRPVRLVSFVCERNSQWPAPIRRAFKFNGRFKPPKRGLAKCSG